MTWPLNAGPVAAGPASNFSMNSKWIARNETVVRLYREYFGYALPSHKQYWTLAGKQVSSRCRLKPESELRQMLSTRLISEGQFHGVDLDPAFIRSNQRGAPKAHWYPGYFYDVLVAQYYAGVLNPGLVFFDSMRMPRAGSEELSSLLAFLSKFNSLILVANFVLHRRFRQRSSEEELFANLVLHPQFIFALGQGWKLDKRAYRYYGSGALMSTVSFVKQ